MCTVPCCRTKTRSGFGTCPRMLPKVIMATQATVARLRSRLGRGSWRSGSHVALSPQACTPRKRRLNFKKVGAQERATRQTLVQDRATRSSFPSAVARVGSSTSWMRRRADGSLQCVLALLCLCSAWRFITCRKSQTWWLPPRNVLYWPKADMS